MGDDVKIKDDLLSQIQAKEDAKAAKTRLEKLVKKEYEIIEEEGTLSEEDQELLDEVDEEAVSEISLEPDEVSDGKKPKKEKKKQS